MKDTFWSSLYRPGYYIQGHHDRTLQKEVISVSYSPSDYGHEWHKECKSLHAAKIAITKHMKSKGETNHGR
jgi:hypothetical protein